MKNEIGSRIQSIRSNLGMTKEKFANFIGVSGQYLGTVERGKNGFTVETIITICEKTGISADYILLGKETSHQEIEEVTVLSDFSPEQIQVAFDIMKEIAVFLRTDNANEILIKEVFLDQQKQKELQNSNKLFENK